MDKYVLLIILIFLIFLYYYFFKLTNKPNIYCEDIEQKEYDNVVMKPLELDQYSRIQALAQEPEKRYMKPNEVIYYNKMPNKSLIVTEENALRNERENQWNKLIRCGCFSGYKECKHINYKPRPL